MIWRRSTRRKKRTGECLPEENRIHPEYSLFILVAGVIALFLLLKKTNWFYKERGLAYKVLKDRYKKERLLRKQENEQVHPMSEKSYMTAMEISMSRMEVFIAYPGLCSQQEW